MTDRAPASIGPGSFGNRFTADYRVRFDEAGPDGRLRTSALLRYAQDVAWRHSEDHGFDRTWYAERGLGWVVRSLELEVLRPIALGTTLQLSTAVIGHRRIWARRLAEARLPAGGLAARVATDWVILDTRGRPVRIPSDFGLTFTSPELRGDVLRVGLPDIAPEVSLRIRVRPHDLDVVGHVNNAVYLDWLEEALLARGGGVAPLDALPRTARLEYVASAGPGDEVEVGTWQDGPSWSARISHVGGREVLKASGTLG